MRKRGPASNNFTPKKTPSSKKGVKKALSKEQSSTAKKGASKSLPKVSFIIRLLIWLKRTTINPYIWVPLLTLTVALLGYRYVYQVSVLPWIKESYRTASYKNGLVVKDVYMQGLTYSSEDDVISAMQLQLGQPIFSVDLNRIQAHLKQLPWVKYASVERLLPSVISVSIIEREPLALWQNQGKVHLLDRQGMRIEERDLKPYQHLVIFIGETAPLYAPPLMQTLNKEPTLAKELSSITRIGDRRWDIRLKDGTLIKLPEKNPQNAWKELAAHINEHPDFLRAFDVIDLRIANKMVVH